MSNSERGLRGKAREQIASVAIFGSAIRTAPGLDPDELKDTEEADE